MIITTESTNSRVLYFSLFSLCCLIGLATWQVLYLRKFFKAKKLIEWVKKDNSVLILLPICNSCLLVWIKLCQSGIFFLFLFINILSPVSSDFSYQQISYSHFLLVFYYWSFIDGQLQGAGLIYPSRVMTLCLHRYRKSHIFFYFWFGFNICNICFPCSNVFVIK